MTNPVQISPSLAAGDLLNLASEIRKLEEGGADSIHFDCMDGHFVPLLTLGVPVLEQVRKITKLPLDVHIMVSNPDSVFADYLKAGADTLTFQIEASVHAHRICKSIRESGKRAGIALNPSTHWRDIEYLLPVLNQVTIMTVNPGFSRQSHIAEMHEKLAELKSFCQKKNLSIDIQIDGGVNLENASLLTKLGANILVAGGAVFNGGDYRSTITRLREAGLKGLNA